MWVDETICEGGGSSARGAVKVERVEKMEMVEGKMRVGGIARRTSEGARQGDMVERATQQDERAIG